MTKEHKIFHDKSPFGERHWQFYKQMNLKLADYADQFNHDLADKIRNCSTYLEFKRDPNTGYAKLARCFYCKDKLCYLCSWRKSLRDFNQLKNILNAADQKEPGCKFIFLTLTAKSSKDKELKNNIRNMNRAVSKLLQYKEIKKFLIGYVRSTEVTVNEEVDKDKLRYHHHVHIILMVKNYFNKNNYIEHSRWVELWKKALKLSYSPIINAKAIKAKDNMTAVEAASRELSKYIVKPSSYLASLEDIKFKNQEETDNHNVNVIQCLHDQLFGLRRNSYGGLLKKVKAEIYGKKSDELLSDNDLTHINNNNNKIINSNEDSGIIKVFWNDFKENYYII